MTTDNYKILSAWVAKGFLFGIFMAILESLLAYCAPDIAAIRAVQIVISILHAPTMLGILPCMLCPHIYLIIVVRIVMIILQWTGIGFIIGYRQYRKIIRTPPPNT